MEDWNEKLKQQIEAELEYCEAATTPFVCRHIQDPESKGAIIQTIADTVIKGKMTIAQAISEVDRLYSNNDID